MKLQEKLYYKMLLIRSTEKKIENLFTSGMLRGTTHGSIGQEAIAVGLLEHINIENDYVTGGHRSHGHLIALTEDVYPLIAELMTKSTGYVKGKGGSQHIRYKNFYCNGITGGMIPIATGLAFSLKLRKEKGIVVAFLGDGAMNEGYVSESFNLACVYQLPILFILENNSFAMSTSTKYATSGSFKKRIKSFGLEYHYKEANDVIKLYNFSKKIINKIRNDKKPIFIEFKTHRFCGHSKSDKREYVPKELDNYWEINDPLKKIESNLQPDVVKKIKDKTNLVIENAIIKANNDH